MNKTSSELIKIAKDLMKIALEFNTQEELEKYKKTHKVRKDTKLTVKDQKKSKSSAKPKSSNQFDNMSETDFVNSAGVLSQSTEDVDGFVKDVMDSRHSDRAKKKALSYMVDYDPSSLEVMKDRNLAKKVFNMVKTNIDAGARKSLEDSFK